MPGRRGDGRPVHLVVVDSWVPGAVAAELAAGRLPALAHLVSHGAIDYRCTSIFPSVTPACLAAVITGSGPDHHHIPGVLWYDRNSDRYVHYWPYPQSLVWGTLSRVLSDFLQRLNGEHLSPTAWTLFERLEAAGIETACVNFPVSRGPYSHRARVPWLLGRLGGVPRGLTLSGPRHFCFGDLLPAEGVRGAGIWGRYGFTDRSAGEHSARLIRTVRPGLMVTYFAENDLRTHHRGPGGIAGSLRRVDRELAGMLAAYGSWDAAVAEARWVLVGDHSQSETFPWRGGHAVNVFEAFPRHRVAPLRAGGLQGEGFDFAACPNDRMCYFYFGRDAERLLAQVRDEAAGWPAVDQILWREGEEHHAWRPHVGARLRWRPGGGLADPWGRRWTLSGDPAALGVSVQGQSLVEGDYPDALARATAALDARPAGTLVLTARLGHEFTSGFPMGRGNHGSLHRLDSWVPLVTTGLPMPSRPRLTDVYGLVLGAFGLAEGDSAAGYRGSAG